MDEQIKDVEVKETSGKKKKTPILVLGIICVVAIIAVVVYLVLDGMGIFGGGDKIIKLADYKNFSYDAFDPTVTEEDVMEYYESLINMYVSYGYKIYEKDESRDGTQVKDGDTVNIDYTGYIDGEAFENGADEGFDLTIGSGQFIDGFESGLVGKTVGETVDVNATFPDPYPNNPDMSGVDAVFTVKINYVGKEVELTSENAYDALFGYDSMDEMVASLKSTLESESASSELSYINTQKSNYVDYIIENTEFKDLTKEADKQADSLYKYAEEAAKSANTDIITYVNYVYSTSYTTADEYKKALQESCLLVKKQNYVMNEIAEIEKITMSDKEYEELAAEIIAEVSSEGSTVTVEQYQQFYDEQYGEGEFRQYMFDVFVLEKLFEMYAKEIPGVATGSTAE